MIGQSALSLLLCPVAIRAAFVELYAPLGLWVSCMVLALTLSDGQLFLSRPKRNTQHIFYCPCGLQSDFAGLGLADFYSDRFWTSLSLTSPEP